MSNTGSNIGLGERNKAKRRDAILDATIELLDVSPTGTVTTEQIAARAEVSPATVYNLVGTREEVLRAIAIRFIAGTTAMVVTEAKTNGTGADPFGLQRFIIERSLTALQQHSQAYRHVIAYLGSLGGATQELQQAGGPTPDPIDFHAESMKRAQRVGAIRRELDPHVLALQVADNLNGVLIRWSFGGLADERLVPLATHGLVTLLLAASTEAHRPRLEAELLVLHRRLRRRPK